MLAGQPPDGYAACCGAIERMDLRDDLPLIGAPTLVVAAADDSATPPEHQELIAATIPDARLVSLPGAAHQAAVEHPAAVARLILDHLGDAP
jgi:3-oxoadipate enol-lactonase